MMLSNQYYVESIFNSHKGEINPTSGENSPADRSTSGICYMTNGCG